MPYRCQGCRSYFRDVPYRRFGLGSVCSEECGQAARRGTSRSPGEEQGVGGRDVPAVTRARVLARDGGCRYCGARSGLHVHHIVYRSEGHDHSERNLITLCAVHHDLVHSDKRRWKPVCQAYITDLYDRGRKAYLLDVERRAGN